MGRGRRSGTGSRPASWSASIRRPRRRRSDRSWVAGHWSATHLRRVAADEELAERVHAGAHACVDESLAQCGHLLVVDALRWLAQRAAVVALEPTLELPRLAVDERAAVQGGCQAGLDLAGRLQLPVDVGCLVVLAVPQQVERSR